MNLKVQTSNDTVVSRIIPVKCRLGLEFRRFSLNVLKDPVEESSTGLTYRSFYHLLDKIYLLDGKTPFFVFYCDDDGELLPITNDMTMACMLRSFRRSVLRLIIEPKVNANPTLHVAKDKSSQKISLSKIGNLIVGKNGISAAVSSNGLSRSSETKYKAIHHSNIQLCPDFRIVSSIIDADVLPTHYRRVCLHRQKENKPLGFYVRDGTVLKVREPGGPVEQVPGIFISKLLPGGLAEGTGLLSKNDEIVEVNGIRIEGKTLDQVTDMMIANSHNLVLTVKPSDQRHNLDFQNHRSTSTSNTTVSSTGGTRRSVSSEEDFIL